MTQDIIVWVIFGLAVVYLLYVFLRSSLSDGGCNNGCSACSNIDFSKIEKQMKSKELSHQDS